MALFMGILMGLLGGPAMAWAYKQPKAVAAFEKRKEKFAQGQGKNPESDPMGPHKTSKQNMIGGGILFFVVGLAAGIGASMVT
ncbi:hypothetical protein [Altererythrobacter sp. ZODW24]|uniref:hypothetical protein n=1 Tax=Altererythrobacter sp. ZODW24 TaxID=2185142 RepID=UPI000DF85F7D|nr:hypothetical protein [Altererythrobacter sp. ZODW24]